MNRLISTLKAKWPELFLEIIVIVAGVFIAYTLNDWGAKRARNQAELEILAELKNNLQLDLIDLEGNRNAHQNALVLLDTLENAAKYGLTNAQIGMNLFRSFRDLVYLPQTSAFETLQAKGVDLISNDSLRIALLRLYDFEYGGIVVIEGEYTPSSYTEDYRYIQNNYFKRFNLDYINPGKSYIVPVQEGYDWLGNADVLVRFDRTRAQRFFMLRMYDQVIESVKKTTAYIEEELTR